MFGCRIHFPILHWPGSSRAGGIGIAPMAGVGMSVSQTRSKVMKLYALYLLMVFGFSAAALDTDSMLRLAGRYVWDDPAESGRTKVIDLHANGYFTATELKDDGSSRIAVGQWKWAGSPVLSGKTHHLFCLMDGEKVIGTISFADQFLQPDVKEVSLQKEETTSSRQLLATYHRVLSNDSPGWWKRPARSLARLFP